MMMTSKKVTIIKGLFIGLIFIIIYLTPFIHNQFLSVFNWSKYSNHYNTHKVIISDSNKDRDKLINNFENDLITKSIFLVSLKSLESKRIKDLKEYAKIKRSIKKEYSFMGYSSFRYFLYAIGLSVFGLFCTILLLIFIFNPNHLNEFRYFYKIAIMGLIYVSTYWLLYGILTRTDFSQWAYGASFGILSILAVALIVLFTYFLSKKENKLKKGIQLLISYISIDLYKKSKNKKEALISDLTKYEELQNVIK